MAGICTEIAFLPLHNHQGLEGLYSGSADPNDTEFVDNAIDTLADQRGCQRACAGLKVEDRNVLLHLIDWTTIEDHNAFTKTPQFQVFCANLASCVKMDEVKLYHVDFRSSVIGPCNAPFTEVLFYYMLQVSKEFESAWDTFISNTAASMPQGMHSTASGWIREEAEHESLGAGVKGRAFVALVGWESVEDHENFRNTAAFKTNIGDMKSKVDIKGAQMFHVAFKKKSSASSW